MDLQQTKILLEKINALYKSISLDEGAMANIERDLMLSYIRQLYESFLDVETSAGAGKKAKSTATTTTTTTAKSNRGPDLEIVEPEPTPEPPKKQYTPPRIIEIPDSIREMDQPVAKPTPPPAPKPKPEPEPQVRATPEPAPEPAAKSSASSPKIESLFKTGSGKELSDKLSQQPISDLNKGMAINDRLLFVNDLFDKNKNAMDNAVRLLNQFSSMTEAKSLLVNLANQYDWTDEEKAETAQSFIKLVQRRYA